MNTNAASGRRALWLPTASTFHVFVHGQYRLIGTANSDGDATRRKRRRQRRQPQPKAHATVVCTKEGCLTFTLGYSASIACPLSDFTSSCSFFPIVHTIKCLRLLQHRVSASLYCFFSSRAACSPDASARLPMTRLFVFQPTSLRRATSTLEGKVQLSCCSPDISVSAVRLLACASCLEHYATAAALAGGTFQPTFSMGRVKEVRPWSFCGLT